MEPMLLEPAGKDYLWGGTRLKTEYSKQIDMVPLAETWECSVHPDGPSTVVNGAFAGRTLAEVLAAHPEYMGTKVGANSTGTGAATENDFPILVKFIDAEKDLSVQVHPDDVYAREHEHQNGKTEMWYVLDAKPGASLVCGFAHNVTREQLKGAVQTGTLAKHLQKVKIYTGDVFFIPAGTIHAIGAGALIAEIQESSNVTYRVYDYDRVDKNGKKRELHFEKAMDVLDTKSGVEVRQKPRMVRYYPGCSRELLCRCQYFETERIQVSREFSFSVLDTSFQVLLCLEGRGILEPGTGAAEQLARGIVPEQLPRGIVSEQLARGIVPEQLPRGIVSEQLPRGIVPEQLARGIVPEQLPRGTVSEQLPQDTVSGQVPRDTVAGQPGLTDKGECLPFKKGDCIFLPAGLGRCHIIGKTALLKVRC